MTLRAIDLQFEYRSNSTNVVDDFYIPCLKESVNYWRTVGYFTSRGLALAAKGLSTFIASGGHMRLVASPFFEPDDISAIERGYETRDAIMERAILRQLIVVDEPQFLKERLSCLTWLVAEGRLDIRVAVPTAQTGLTGIYHEKAGIFTDSNGDSVAFTGSANETVGGLATNFESIDVFVSWDDTHGRTVNKRSNFEHLWNDSTPGLQIIDFPVAAKK